MTTEQPPKALTLPVQWDKVSFPASRAHCGVLTLVTTKEIIEKPERDVLRHLCDDDEVGWMVFVRNEAEAANAKVPDVDAPVERGQKRPSERLRATLFIRWRQLGEPLTDFDTYYKQEMNYIISEYQALLEPRD